MRSGVLAVLNCVRSCLPVLAGLAVNGPLHSGRDTGLASLRPKLSELLPRQGVPPAFRSWPRWAISRPGCGMAADRGVHGVVEWLADAFTP